MKLSRLENLMDQAKVVSKLSKDAETKVGALLITRDLATIATGYNGFIRGAPDDKLPNTRDGGKYPYMVHAEINLLTHCARHGISTNDCILVITLSPCTDCLRAVWQAGIKEIYFLDEYRDFNKSAAMLDLSVKMSKVCTKSYELSRIQLEPAQ